MAILLVAVALVVAVAVHERLARPWRPLRTLALLAVVGLAVLFGSGAQPHARVLAWLRKDPPALPFEPRGDFALIERVQQQAPERPFPAGGSREEIEAWRDHVVAALREGVPEPRVEIPVRVLSTETLDGVARTFLEFTARDGTPIPAFACEPAGGGPRAGVLVIPGHGDGIRATAGLVDDYQHAAALALARAGYATLTPELRGFGLLAGVEHRLVAHNAVLAGSSYKAVLMSDLQDALSVLAARDQVDDARLAVTGASFGGEATAFLAAVDPRVRAAAVHAHGGHTGPASATTGPKRPHGCHMMPGSNRLLWSEDWFRLVAPRPLLVVRGRDDLPRGGKAFARAVSEAYAAFGADAAFRFETPPGGHELFVDLTVDFLASLW